MDNPEPGTRATIAASLLEREGIACVVVDDHFDIALNLGLAVDSGRRPMVAAA